MELKLAVQFLEDQPGLSAFTPREVESCLKAAFTRLPIDCLILGWNVPDSLYEICSRTTGRMGARLFHWHPLLTGHSTLVPRPEWRSINPGGQAIPAFHDLPEFTFLCPNHPVVQDLALRQLENAIRRRNFQGVFLDRIRHPSPAGDPENYLGCFCSNCRQVAAAEGLDLEDVKGCLERLLKSPERVGPLIELFLNPGSSLLPDPELAVIQAFLHFRARSITNFVRAAAEIVRTANLELGLDCFSPSLATMVGQDLSGLDAQCDWIKIMTYGHTLGPAGLPFELRQWAKWLVRTEKLSEEAAMEVCVRATGLPLPSTLGELELAGIPSSGLSSEALCARAAGVRTLLAGIELVEKDGITRLNEAQIRSDLSAVQAARVDGLVLSWDLRHMPLKWLDLVGRCL